MLCPRPKRPVFLEVDILQWGSGCFAGHSFKFQKRSQHFIGVHNETLSVAAIRICNPVYALL